MAEASDSLEHPVFGSLAWDSKYGWWQTVHRLRAGSEIDVIVDPGDEDRFEFLPKAAELFQWAVASERLVLAEALRAELLQLYNDTWRRSAEPVLSADELTAQLDWQLLSISASEIVPVEFSYGAGDLFGCHGVTVEVDAELRFRDIDLRG
jgi:hypothetical protein